MKINELISKLLRCEHCGSSFSKTLTAYEYKGYSFCYPACLINEKFLDVYSYEDIDMSYDE